MFTAASSSSSPMRCAEGLAKGLHKTFYFDFSGCDCSWNVSLNYISLLTSTQTSTLSAVRCHLWNIRWHHAVRTSSRLSLARDGYNRTNSGVTWNLYILFMCNRNNILAWSHHLWTSCFCWPKMLSSASHSSQELYCFYIHALFPWAYLLLFSITVFFLFLVDTLLKEKTASLLELVNNTLIHKSYINYKKCHLKFKVCTYT